VVLVRLKTDQNLYRTEKVRKKFVLGNIFGWRFDNTPNFPKKG
jgi:hypothetical protein